MSWTHSGMFVEKLDNLCRIYADEEALKLFADDTGNFLHPHFVEEFKETLKEKGLYQCWIGYGTMQDQTIYTIKKIADVNWNYPPEENSKKILEAKE